MIKPLLISLSVFLACTLYGNVNKNGDTGLWLEQSFQKKISNSLSANLNIHERIGNNFRTYYYQRYRGILNSIIYQNSDFAEKWEIGFGYSFTQQKRGERWVNENLYLIQSILSQKWLSGTLQQRGRLSYIDPHFSRIPKHLTVRYRLLFRTPWEITKFKLTPWISNELFFRENSFNAKKGRGIVGNFFQNRFRIGLWGAFFKNLSYDFYIQWRSLKQQPQSIRGWNTIFDLGFNTIFSF